MSTLAKNPFIYLHTNRTYMNYNNFEKFALQEKAEKQNKYNNKKLVNDVSWLVRVWLMSRLLEAPFLVIFVTSFLAEV